MCAAAELTPKVIVERLRKVGVSQPYAYQIAHGTRAPSLELAVKAANEAGVRVGVLKGASDHEVAVVTRLVARQAAAK